ncbi:MAG: hypothetical protein ABL971_14250 [Vicinamibacterales bacterium]
MRGYYLPLGAGLLLVASAFLPRVVLGDVAAGRVPDAAALWILGLGLAAVLLASLSLYTRKNSRHPLLLVGLIALGLEFLSWQVLRRALTEQAWAAAQAAAIVGGDGSAAEAGTVMFGSGLILGGLASIAIAGFGLTIVFKQAVQPYAAPVDDDV